MCARASASTLGCTSSSMDAPERALSGSPGRALCQGDGGRGYTPAAAMGPGGGSRQRVLGFGRHAICSARREGRARRRGPRESVCSTPELRVKCDKSEMCPCVLIFVMRVMGSVRSRDRHILHCYRIRIFNSTSLKIALLILLVFGVVPLDVYARRTTS